MVARKHTERAAAVMSARICSADLAVILIDARYGVLTQTRRHSFIVSLLGIRHIVVAGNKMDLMDYSEKTYRKIAEDYETFANDFGLKRSHNLASTGIVAV